MRLRNVKGSREMIATNDFVVHEEETMKGKWHDFFENENPIHIEVGMGKGRFIIDMAKLHPEINYIGIEKYSSVLVRAIEKQTIEQLPNLVFIRMDAEAKIQENRPYRSNRPYRQNRYSGNGTGNGSGVGDKEAGNTASEVQKPRNNALGEQNGEA